MSSQVNNPPQGAPVAGGGAMMHSGQIGMTQSGIQLNTLKAVPHVLPKKSRPLNSWIAFRTYYLKVLGDQPQRDVSVLLTSLWQADPHRAKWGVIASAYTTIRDLVGKDLAPLDKFLTLICPQMGITSVHDYMVKFGWTLHQTDDGSYFVSQAVPYIAKDDGIPSVIKDDMELVVYAVNHGYMPSEADHQRYLATITTAGEIKSVATMSIPQARAAFNHALRHDTVSVGAMILGIPMDHVFFTKVAYNPLVSARIDDTNSIQIQKFKEQENAKRGPVTVAPLAPMSGYQWAGRMNDLYNATAGGISLPNATTGQGPAAGQNNMAGQNKTVGQDNAGGQNNTGNINSAGPGETTTDISDPAALDNHLAAQGHSAESLKPNVPASAARTPPYSFSESF